MKGIRQEKCDGRRATANGRNEESRLLVLPRPDARRPTPIAAAAIVLAAMTLAGCGDLQPWVKPYERQALADPIMAFDANPVSTAYMDHVFEAREGARGALGSAGGGCGCN